MVFAISYSLLEGQLSRKKILPSFLCLILDASQKYIPQSEEFTDNKTLLLVAAPHISAAP
jgi:hypothetical protein